jgi:CubicO group peptidase (beta-lactamase class C family)
MPPMRNLALLLTLPLLAGCLETPPATGGAGLSRDLRWPVGTADTMFQTPMLVGSFSAMDRILPARRIAAPPAAQPLRPAATPLPELRWTAAGRDWTIERYLEDTMTTGLLLLKRDGTILLERYARGREPADRFASWSMAKTVTAMLTGLALARGEIRSLDEPAVTYVPALAGSPYAEVPIGDLLTMSSGVAWDETYSGWGSDPGRLSAASYARRNPGGAASVAHVTRRRHPTGTAFNYNSADTQVLGLVLAAAVRQSLAQQVEERLWRPMGAEADASWQIDSTAQEAAFCCLNATLRDFGRLGLLLANGGRALDGRQVLPPGWAERMMTPPAPHLEPGRLGGNRPGGYGYQTWTSADGRSASFVGVHGQRIDVNRPSGVVLVRTAADPSAAPEPGQLALINAAHRAIMEAAGAQFGAVAAAR